MTMTIAEVLGTGPVIPVIVIADAAQAVPLAVALVEGGVRVIEVTLRSSAALEAVRRIAGEAPDAIVGVGTITRPQDRRSEEGRRPLRRQPRSHAGAGEGRARQRPAALARRDDALRGHRSHERRL
jgi:hypothetical protein